MERLSDLFFELSHEDRLTILMNLHRPPGSPLVQGTLHILLG